MARRLPAGRKQLHIDKAAMASRSAPPILIRTEGGAINTVRAHICGESWFVYDPAHPLPETGTYAWIETWAPVDYED
ncbi:MAG: hypothetical protein WBR29_03070 [Gammaproteobacteria bacterium]